MLSRVFWALFLVHQVLAFQQAKLEFQDLWGDPTFPISKIFQIIFFEWSPSEDRGEAPIRATFGRAKRDLTWGGTGERRFIQKVGSSRLHTFTSSRLKIIHLVHLEFHTFTSSRLKIILLVHLELHTYASSRLGKSYLWFIYTKNCNYDKFSDDLL